MKITITVDQLRQANACRDGISAFVRHFGGDSVELDWTLERQLEMVRSDLREWLGWAWSFGVVPMWSMRGANLVRANLVRADLEGANLVRANLVRANLEGANLVRANLVRANLFGANLEGANLFGANLEGANLEGANLEGANLFGANLVRATGLPDNLRPMTAGGHQAPASAEATTTTVNVSRGLRRVYERVIQNKASHPELIACAQAFEADCPDLAAEIRRELGVSDPLRRRTVRGHQAPASAGDDQP